MVAVSINFYTGIYSGEALPSRWGLLILAAAASFISSAAWAVISWNLDSIQRLAISEAPSWIDHSTADAAWLSLLKPRALRLQSALIVAVFSAVVGLGALPVGWALTQPQISATKQTNQVRQGSQESVGKNASELSPSENPTKK
jgi:hypothetical protein